MGSTEQPTTESSATIPQGRDVSGGFVVLGVGLVVLLLGWVAGREHLARRALQHRYATVVEGQRQLERRYADAILQHETLVRDLVQQRQRSEELAGAVGAYQDELATTRTRLYDAQRVTQELGGQVAALRGQLDKLQAELSLALATRPPGEVLEEASAVRLERIVVNSAGGEFLHGRILSVNPEWDFAVVDLGWDTLSIGDTVSILRGDQTLAKARVDRVQEDVSIVTMLPEWTDVDIRVNDLVH